MKEEELEIKTEIEITDAKTKIIEELEKNVLQDLEIEESLQNNDHCVRANHPERKQTATVTLNPDALPWEDQRNNAHPTVTTKMCQSRNTPVHISETNNAFLNGNSEQPNNNTYYEPGHPLQDSYSAFIPTPPQTPAFRIHENSTSHVVSSQQPYSAFPMQISNAGNSDNNILTVACELNKPKAEIQNFNGNPMDYNRFLRQFNTRICHNTDSYEERLNFLLQFTTEEAHRIVIGYSHLDSERGYNAALKEFRDRYGDTDVIAQSYIKKALDWPIIKTDDAKALDSFSIYLKECQFAIENVEAARMLEYSENVKLLVKKLPYYLHEKWRNIVYDLKEKRQIVKFHHLVNFAKKLKRQQILYREEMSRAMQNQQRLHKRVNRKNQ